MFVRHRNTVWDPFRDAASQLASGIEVEMLAQQPGHDCA
jgi:hypothetical protein